MRTKDRLVEIICINLCGEPRCDRFPDLSDSCKSFVALKRTYQAGRREVVEFLRSNLHPGQYAALASWPAWEAQLKIWFKDNPELLIGIGDKIMGTLEDVAAKEDWEAVLGFLNLIVADAKLPEKDLITFTQDLFRILSERNFRKVEPEKLPKCGLCGGTMSENPQCLV